MSEDTKDIVDGIGAGVFFSIFLTLYLDAFTGVVLPIWMIYGILVPLVSSISIAILIFSSKRKRDDYITKYWEKSEDN